MSTPATTAPKTASTAAPAPKTAAAGPATPAPVAPEKPALSADFISGGGFILAPELAEQSAPKNARNERQTAMDLTVSQMHEMWVKAGRPNTWAKMVEGKTVKTYFVDPTQAGDLKKLVNSAVSLHDVRVRWGTPFKATDKMVKAYNLPAEYLGREVISFAIMDKRPRGTANGQTAAAIVANVADANKK